MAALACLRQCTFIRKNVAVIKATLQMRSMASTSSSGPSKYCDSEDYLVPALEGENDDDYVMTVDMFMRCPH